MTQVAKAWTLADAKAHLSEVVESALKKGPQVITRHGRKAVVVVALSGDSHSESTMADALQVLLENDVIAYVLQIYDGSKHDNCDVLHIYEKDSHGESLLKKLAEATGGRMLEVRGIDKLEAALDEISDELHHQYSLGYYPENKHWDGKFRKIQVKLQHDGYTLAYRRGYYAASPNSVDKATATLAQPAAAHAAKGVPHPLPPLDPMRAAMMRGGPDPTQIFFKARILPATTAPEDALAPGSKPNPNAKLSHGPYRRYQVDIVADPRDLLYTSTGAGASALV